MTLPKIYALCVTLMLNGGCASREGSENGQLIRQAQFPGLLCDSNRVAELIEAINSTNTSYYAKFDFGESDVLGWLFKCADVAFKTADGEHILLARPEPLGGLPVSELDYILAKRGLRKELAVVFIEHFWESYVLAKDGRLVPADPFQKTTGEFAFEVNRKLHAAGFKQVIFAYNYNGFHHRMWVPTI
jgi:hypothetical protein